MLNLMKKKPKDYLMQAEGKQLDNMGAVFGMRRKKYWFIIPESDKTYRRRIVDFVQNGKVTVK